MKKMTIKKLLVFVGVTILCAGGVTLLFAGIKDEIPALEPEKRVLRPVTVIGVTVADETARIQAFGQVSPVWTARLRSRVAGRIVRVSDRFQPGARVVKGEALMKIDDVDYVAARDGARTRVATAEVALLKEMEERSQAVAGWERSGIKGSPGSELVFHDPQLKAARAEVAAAKSALLTAERDLAATIVTAPFNGEIVTRRISRGDSLFAGDDIAMINSVDRLEVKIFLGEDKERMVGDDYLEKPVVITRGEDQWEGRLVRRAGSLDSKTRLRAYFVAIPDSGGTLLPGMFVDVSLTGKTLKNVLRLPESVQTRDNTIWYVDGEDRLASFTCRPLFNWAGTIVVAPPDASMLNFRMVKNPMAGFIANEKVAPVKVEVAPWKG
ncbi:MAG: efflux RND transporter periplasmic adaptor subunit [Desulfobacterium sp.]|nr:efflux RND transporter periplasmic adaptor subunit [Desulfobacterium sp.]